MLIAISMLTFGFADNKQSNYYIRLAARGYNR